MMKKNRYINKLCTIISDAITKGEIGTIVDYDEGTYEVDFDNGFVGWYKRKELSIYGVDDRNDEIVKHNIQQAKEILYKAERTNKGAYVHELGKQISWMKSYLKKSKKMTFDCKYFKNMCKKKQEMAATLYMNEHKI